MATISTAIRVSAGVNLHLEALGGGDGAAYTVPSNSYMIVQLAYGISTSQWQIGGGSVGTAAYGRTATAANTFEPQPLYIGPGQTIECEVGDIYLIGTLFQNG